LGIQGCSLSTNWHLSAIKANAQVGAESAGMRGKLLEALGLVASTVERQTHNILGTITSVENSTYLPIIVTRGNVKIRKPYQNLKQNLDATPCPATTGRKPNRKMAFSHLSARNKDSRIMSQGFEGEQWGLLWGY
jgi:hypothetical protein